MAGAAEEAPEVYDATDRFMEAADWVVMQLTGTGKRATACTAGYKAIVVQATRAILLQGLLYRRSTRGMENVVEEKLSTGHMAHRLQAGEV